METIEKRANPVVTSLIGADEDTLLELLGMRAKATQEGAPSSSGYNPTIAYNVQAMGPLDEVRDLGRRLLARWMRELHKVACGSADEDKGDRESILKSLGLNDVAAGAAIVTVLVSTFAVAPAVATVIAALIVKRVIEPAGDEICKFWDEQLKND